MPAPGTPPPGDPPSGTPAPDASRLRLVEALRTIERLRQRLAVREAAPPEPIAIVGMACRFPDRADSPEAFWHLLRNGHDAVREYPASRATEHIDVRALFDPDPDAPGRTRTVHGTFLDRVDRFDPEVFGIGAAEARAMDPQQRLALEVAWEAFEQAGYAPDALSGRRVGVRFGVGSADYPRLREQIGDIREVDGHHAMGEPGLLAGRISHTFGLRGPSQTVDAACASSLVAVHDACRDLRLGECDLALAGGVNLLLAPYGYVLRSKLGVLSGSGRVRAFDARADGYVRGEGVGAVLLKRYADAVADGDRILAVVRGSAVNHDGRSSGLTVPNPAAQQELIRAALAQAAVDPSDVDYVEAHGVGIAVADQVELRALGAVLGRGARTDGPLLVGSVKTNIGHLEAAAGIAGLIKLVLAIRHGEIPPQLGFEGPAAGVDLARDRIEVVVSRTAWPQRGRPRIGAVSAFGLSGTNAHLVVGAAPEPAAAAPAAALPAVPDTVADPAPGLLVVSARTAPALHRLADDYARYLRRESGLTLADVCFTSQVGRARLGLGLAVVGSSLDDLAAALDGWARDGRAEGVSAVALPAHGRRRTAWLFPGESGARPGAGRALLDRPVFREAFEECAALFGPELDRPLAELAWPEADGGGPADGDPAGVFAVEYALAVLWNSWGLRPAVLAGTGVGEVVAACLAGVVDLAGAVALVAARRRLAAALPPGALHSPAVRPGLPDFRAAVAGVAFAEPRLPLVSSLTGELWTGREVGAEYWARQVAGPPLLTEALRTVHAEGARTFLDLGPAPVLAEAAARVLPADGAVFTGSLRPRQDDTATILTALGVLHLRGATVDWKAVHAGGAGRRTALPTIPWCGEPYWFRPAEQARDTGAPPNGTPVVGLGIRVHSAVPTYELSLGEGQWESLTRVDATGRRYLPLGALIGVALTAAHDCLGGSWTCVEDVVIYEMLPADDIETRTVQLIIRLADEGHAIAEILSITAIEEAAGAPWRLHSRGVLRRRVRTQQLGESADRLDVRLGVRPPYLEIERSSLSVALSDVLERAHRGNDAVVVALAADSDHGWIELMDAAVAAVSWAAARPNSGRVVVGMARRYGGLACTDPGRVRYVRATAARRGRGEAIGAVEFFAEDGANLGGMDKVHVVPSSYAGMRSEPWADPRDLLYSLEWQPLPAGPEPGGADGEGYLLVAGRGAEGEQLAGELRARGAQVRVAEVPVTGTAADCVPDRTALRELVDGWSSSVERPARVVLLTGLDAPVPEQADPWVLEEYLARADLTAVALVQELAAHPRCAGTRIAFVTRGAMPVRDGDPVAAPVGATLWGLGRALAVEQPQRWAGAVDLAPVPSADEAARLADALASTAEEDQQAVRGGTRFVPRLTADPLDRFDAHREPTVRAEGAYLVTGAFGTRGMRLAHWLARAGAGRLILVDDATVPDRAAWYDKDQSPEARMRVREVCELESLGVEVDVVTCDVTDADTLVEVLQAAQAGPLPVRGVIHAAVQHDRFPIDRVLPADYRRVVRPGVIGGWLLHELTATAELDFFVCLSDAADVWGTAGRAGGAAAGAFLGSLAHHRTARRLPGLTVAWGPCHGTWDDAGDAAADELRATGVHPLAPLQCIRMLAALVVARRTFGAVCRVDWPRCTPTGADGRGRPVLRELQAARRVPALAPTARRDGPAASGRAGAAVSDDSRGRSTE